MMGHLPPEGMVSVSGPTVKKLVQDIHDRIMRAVDHEHLDLDIAINLALVVCVDLIRANAGDAEALRVVDRATRQRLSKSMEYWGVTKGRKP